MSDTPAPGGSTFSNAAALIAVLISVSALGVSIFEASTQRANQRAAVWPYVEIYANYSSDGYLLALENKGVGPARLRWARMLVDGEVISDLDAMVLAELGEDEAFSYDLYGATDPSGRVFSPRETGTLFTVPWEERTRRLINQLYGRIDIQACYCSIYDECWTVTFQTEPEPVRACPAPPQ
ncbi:hypothetical protein [Maricaulis sp.]|uniref:hypothetical protein n=1 Tax=Maricaulis sp. TaxID=1486257 RepID=UPI002635B60A|nr:hypothetical protein [Maricaulis sp.]